ncbi:Uncharacterised protein [Plesiomonas shigelloides]|uniref:hypothetical protein n=1 Tax=Plesiomonas shigelloides TaxID=703 RepID=UPI0007EDB032|nr:hypothetical protein [Plesiomonas shigelloides]SBT60914.1 Uncharacterised protein [Plesiomonas shigelloides]
MYYFDDVVEEVINGKFYAVIIYSETSSRYVMADDVVIETSISGFEGIQLTIKCLPNKYSYRGELHSEEEMKRLSDKIMKIAHEVDWKNNSIHSPYNT